MAVVVLELVLEVVVMVAVEEAEHLARTQEEA